MCYTKQRMYLGQHAPISDREILEIEKKIAFDLNKFWSQK